MTHQMSVLLLFWNCCASPLRVLTLVGAASGVPASAAACAASLGAEAAAYAALPADVARGRSAANQSGLRCRPAQPHTDLPQQVRPKHMYKHMHQVTQDRC